MKSNMRLVLISVVLLMAAMIVAPAAALEDVENGDTIFVYEEDLDLTDLAYVGNDIELVKYVDDADPYGKEPKAQINSIAVADITSFDVLDSQVGDDYGLYYVVAGDHTNETTKSVNIRMPDVAVGVTLAGSGHSDSLDGKSVSKSADIAFKLTTRYVAAEYSRIEAAVDVEIQTPGGAKTVDFGGADLEDIALSSSRFWTDDVGETIDLTNVESGKYIAQAKWSSPQGFSDYAENSNTVSFTVTSKKIAIESNKDNVVRGNNFVVTITGDSKTPYWVYVKDASVSAEKYPVILKGQSGVKIVADNPALKDDAEAVVKSEYPIDAAIALVTTKADGKRPVEFVTNGTTDDSTFTMKVMENKTDGKYDTVKVKVEKGAVTVTSSGTQSYFLGSEITFSGTNTDSDNIYLFIKGSNLNSNGASLIKGKGSKVTTTTPAEAEAEGFVVESVESDDTWEYKWDTADVNLDAATYTVYAVSQPYDRSDISDAEYASIPVTIKEAFVTAEASSKTVAKGDSLYVRGTAEGSPSEGVMIWVLGRNYVGPAKTGDFGTPTTQSVEDDGSYEYEFDNTDDLSSGQYFIVVQHPMKNGFGLKTALSNDGDAMNVVNEVSGSTEFVIDGVGSLQGSNAAEALINALESPNIDDTYVKLSFSIQEPTITIDPIGEHAVGETFTITGKTNLAVGDDLTVDITSSSFKPTEKTQTSGVGGTSGTVPVVAGDDENTWSFEVVTTTFQPDDYIVKVESIEADMTTTNGFSLVKATPTVEPTETSAVEPTETAQPTATATAEATPTATPGFGAILALIGLGAVAVLVLRKD